MKSTYYRDKLQELANKEGTPREFQRLKWRFPLFEWTWKPDCNLAQAQNGSTGYSMKIENDRLLGFRESELIAYHAEAKAKQDLQKLYPFLSIHISIDTGGFIAYAWDARSGYSLDGDGTSLASSGFHTKYASLNDLAYTCTRTKGFVCTCCNTLQEAENKGFTHFASIYCKECAEKNPEAAKAAARETYE